MQNFTDCAMSPIFHTYLFFHSLLKMERNEPWRDDQEEHIIFLFFVINSSPSAKPALADLTDTHKGPSNAVSTISAIFLIAHISGMDATL